MEQTATKPDKVNILLHDTKWLVYIQRDCELISATDYDDVLKSNNNNGAHS